MFCFGVNNASITRFLKIWFYMLWLNAVNDNFNATYSVCNDWFVEWTKPRSCLQLRLQERFITVIFINKTVLWEHSWCWTRALQTRRKWYWTGRKTLQCRYNTVNFIRNCHNRHPIARPQGRAMGCLLWVQAWFIFWLRHCSIVCIIMLYWIAL